MATDDRPWVQYAVAADLYLIAQHCAKFFQAGRVFLGAVFDYDQSFVRFYIGGDGTSAHMGLIAEDGIAYVIVIGYLHLVKEDNVFQFGGVAYYGAFAYDGVSTDKCTVADLRAFVNDGRAVEVGGGGDFGSFSNPDILTTLFKEVGGKAFA